MRVRGAGNANLKEEKNYKKQKKNAEIRPNKQKEEKKRKKEKKKEHTSLAHLHVVFFDGLPNRKTRQEKERGDYERLWLYTIPFFFSSFFFAPTSV